MSRFHLEKVDTADVKRMLDSGEYFVQARIWYTERYLRPLGERSFFVVMTLLCALTIFLSLVVYSSMFPLQRNVPYTILGNFETMYEDRPFIRPLRVVPAEDINLSVARFLLNNYVVTREKHRYEVLDIERRFARLRSTTADDAFYKYQKETSPENPSSPTNKYGRNATREVAIQRVDMKLEKQPNTARVYYSTLLTSGTNRQINQWVATITFRFPKLTVDQDTNKVLQWSETTKSFKLMQNVDFEITDYATQEINAARQ